jgi:glucose-1-phosphate thymidylyltransferase
VGLLPAAGRGVRFGASGYIKELFPLLFTSDSDDRILEPRPLCEMALRAIRAAGAERCLVLVSPEKLEVLRVLGSGSGVGLTLAYGIQTTPGGLSHVVRTAASWLADSDVVFAMPDTIALPPDALKRTHERRIETGADLTLGVFPMEDPERFGAVEIGPDGGVVRILREKTPQREVKTIWGVVAWSHAFTKFCAEWDEEAERKNPAERLLSHAFIAAFESGMKVSACVFERGLYLDIGTPSGLRAALRSLTEHGLLDQVQAVLGLAAL